MASDILTRLTREEVESAASALIEARKTNLGIEVTMPVIYPTGQCVTVVVTVEGGEYVVHDAGFGAMFLAAEGVKFTSDLHRRLRNLAERYSCDFIESRMTQRCTVEQLSVAIALVANASRTVGDQALNVRQQPEYDFREVVAERVRTVVGRRARDNQEFRGGSGRMYRVSNVVLDSAERRPVAFVEATHTRATLEHHYTEFSDLRFAYAHVSNISIYDEQEKWTRADLSLLARVSEVYNLKDSKRGLERLAA